MLSSHVQHMTVLLQAVCGHAPMSIFMYLCEPIVIWVDSADIPVHTSVHECIHMYIHMFLFVCA